MIAPEAAHCSHAYLDKALVITGEATVSSRRQDPRRWGRPVDQVAGSRRDPAVGGPQRPAEKPASADTDDRDPRPAGLQLYPRGVGLYKPPGAPMQRVGFLELYTHHIKREVRASLVLLPPPTEQLKAHCVAPCPSSDHAETPQSSSRGVISLESPEAG